MADDDMEISSEHGHNDVDEDIDIDIDFAAGHFDEDHILEDVAHEMTDNDLQPVVAYDEEMADEEDNSYQMDDVDVLHDEAAPNADVESVSFGTDALVHTEDYTKISSPKAEEFEYEEAYDLDPSNDADQQTVPDDTDVLETEETHQSVQPENEDEVLAGEESGDVFHDDPASTTLQHQNIREASVADEPRSPASTRNSVATAVENTTDIIESELEPVQEEVDQIVPVDLDTTVDLETSIDQVLSVAIPDVIVAWDGKDYPLFAASTSDNPDTYFLSDISILEQPLEKFFEAIRYVIQGDLGEEDELVLSIDDLGLEASETSTSIQSVSLSQIFDLRQQLLQNDGDDDHTQRKDESWNQFYISISVKKSFSKRLSNLLKGAAEGKRLSDFWEEQTHSMLEFREEVENTVDHESGLESLSENVNDGEDHEDPENNPQAEQAPSNPEHRSLSPSIKDNKELGVDKTASTSTGDLSEANIANTQPKVDIPAEKSHDDGDELLDYSEDELEYGDETNGISTAATDNDRPNEGDDSIDQIPLHPTLSHHSYEEQETHLESHSDTGEAAHESREEAAGDDFDDLDYNGEAVNPPAEEGADLDQYDHEDGTGTNPAPDEHQNYGANYEVPLTDDGVFAEDNVPFEPANDVEEYADLLREGESFAVELGTEIEIHSGVPLRNSTDTISTNNADYPQQSNEGEVVEATTTSAAHSVAFPDTTESSVTLSADEINYEDVQEDVQEDEALDFSIPTDAELLNGSAKAVLLEHEDEIDYEDDEEEEAEKVEVTRSGQSPPEIKEYSPHGKRSITEVDSDDILDTRSNSTKRPRS